MSGEAPGGTDWLAALLRLSLDAAVALDEEGRVTEWNARAEEVFGWTAGEATGKMVSELIVPPKYREAHEAGLRRALTEARAGKPRAPVALSAVHKEGHKVPIEFLAAPIEGAAPHRFLAFLRDLTRLREAERDAAEARSATESALRGKAHFLSEMAHEFRAPVNALTGYADLLLEEATEAIRPDLEKIRSAATHVMKLVERILDYSRIEEGRAALFPEVFDISALAQEVVAMTAPLAEKNGSRIEVSCAPGVGTMHGDANRIRQCMAHLLMNAASFTERGVIELAIQRTRRLGQEWVVLTVTDNGPGMGAKELALLFQPFGQASITTTARYDGAGLGLAISQRLCRMMGGDLTAESEHGKGSVFTMVIPAKTAVLPAMEDRPRGGWEDVTRT